MRVGKGPRYYKSKKAWFANLHNQRALLVKGPKGATEAEAVRLYNDLVLASAVDQKGDRSPTWTVLNAYLAWASTRVEPPPLAPNTLGIAKRYIDSAVEAFGEVAVKDLTHGHVDKWFAANQKTGNGIEGWGPGGRRIASQVLKAAFRWASGPGGACKTNPLRGLPRGRAVNYRGRKGIVSRTTLRSLVAQAIGRTNRDFAYAVLLLDATGARPSEVLGARAEEWDQSLGAFVIEPEGAQGRFKLARHGERRVVFVPEGLRPLVEAIVARRPTGLLFRTEGDGPIGRHAISARIARARRRDPSIPKTFTLYGLRHGFVTRWMATPGCDVKALAVLLNTSIQQIEKTYSHLFKEHSALRGALEAFERGRERPGPDA